MFAALQDPYEPEDEDDYELKPGKGKADGQQVRTQPPYWQPSLPGLR